MTENKTTWKVLPVEERALRECVARCRRANVKYGLGSKAPRMSAEPGKDFARIDCSGFVRWAIWQASPADDRVTMPDGSWHQGQWAEKQGFKQSDSKACLLKDGRVRLAYWRNPSGVSHIALVLNGKTLESHGSRGPNRRTWDLDVTWMRDAKVWVLETDTDQAGDE